MTDDCMTDDGLPHELDWLEIRDYLLKGAGWWGRTNNVPSIFDGVSVEDVVDETIVTYLCSPDKLGWDPKRGPLENLLGRVCANKLVDHYRRYLGKQRSTDDPTFASQLASNSNAQDLFHRRHFAMQMLRVLKDRIAQMRPYDGEKLLEIVRAVEIMKDDVLKDSANKCIADFLNLSVREVENRKKRLRRLMPELTDPGAN